MCTLKTKQKKQQLHILPTQTDLSTLSQEKAGRTDISAHTTVTALCQKMLPTGQWESGTLSQMHAQTCTVCCTEQPDKMCNRNVQTSPSELCTDHFRRRLIQELLVGSSANPGTCNCAGKRSCSGSWEITSLRYWAGRAARGSLCTAHNPPDTLQVGKLSTSPQAGPINLWVTWDRGQWVWIQKYTTELCHGRDSGSHNNHYPRVSFDVQEQFAHWAFWPSLVSVQKAIFL